MGMFLNTHIKRMISPYHFVIRTLIFILILCFWIRVVSRICHVICKTAYIMGSLFASGIDCYSVVSNLRVFG